jgi:hypothetical protein
MGIDVCTTAYPGIASCGKYAGGGGGGAGDPGGGGGILGTPAPGLCRTPQYGAGNGGVASGGDAGAVNRGGGGGGGGENASGGTGGSGYVIIKEPEVSLPATAPGVWSMNTVYDYVKQGVWPT